MSRRKRKTLQLLALFVVAILAFSSFGSVAAAATMCAGGGSEDCNIASYTATSELTDKTDLTQYLANKADSYQQNTQTSADITDSTYSTSLLQSAEWTDKAAGEAAVNIHYEADFSEIELRSLYVFTTCTGHSFNQELAIENIIELLEYNDYVDVVMIGANNRLSEDGVKADAAAAMMFSLSASVLAEYEDGTEFLATSGVTTTYNRTDGSSELTKAEIIKNVLDTRSDDDFNEYTQYGVYKLGQAGTGVGEIADLYNEIYWNFDNGEFTFYDNMEYSSAIDMVLSFGSQRHAGEVFTLYFIAEYINIIEDDRGLDFSTTVQAIFNSFDAFATASRNTDDAFLTDTLYTKLAELIGVNLGGTEKFSRNNLNKDCKDALEILEGYTEQSRYIVLIPDANHTDSYNTYTITYEMLEDLDEEQISALKNTLVYTLTVMNPHQPEENIWGVVDSLIGSVLRDEESQTLAWGRLQEFNSNIYSYAEDFETTGALNVLYSVSNEATITTTITSEFDVDVNNIKVTNFGSPTTSFDYEVATEEDDDGNTTVTITFSNLTDTANTDTHIQGETDSWGTSWSIDISIPAQLVDNTEFRTSDDDFKETNVSDTTAFVERVRTITKNDANLGTETIAETVTVASPKLYKAFDSSLSIAKTDSAANSEASDTTTETTSTGVLPKAGDSIGALLPIIVAVALGACVVAVVAAFALRKRRRF